MAQLGMLTDRRCRTAAPGMHHDGGGLYLQCRRGADGAINKSWVFRYTEPGGRQRWLGLGPFHSVPLAVARRRAEDMRRARTDGVDILATKRAQQACQGRPAAKQLTFSEAATAFIATHEQSWRRGYARQWRSTLDRYAKPCIGEMAVGDITTADVLKMLLMFWHQTPAAGALVRAKVEAVLDYASVIGARSAEKANPASWRILRQALPAAKRLRPTRHHAAMKWQEVPEFYRALGGRSGHAAACLRLVILTGVRSNEARRMEWVEVDFIGEMWVIPAQKMKSGREFRIPLSGPVIELLQRQPRDDGYVFSGRGAPHLGHSALRTLLAAMGMTDCTPHGFRSALRVFSSEVGYPHEVGEAALSHATGDVTARSYMRSDLLQRRIALLRHWADFVTGKVEVGGGEVVPLRKQA